MIGSRLCGAMGIGMLVGVLAAAPPNSRKRKPPAEPAYPPLPSPAAKLQLENVLGGTRSIADYRGKVVLLSVVGTDPADPSGAISEPIGYTFSHNPDFQRVTVADLKGFFQVMQPMIRNRARHDYDQGEVNLVDHFKQHNLAFHPYNHNTLLIDFSGNFSRGIGTDKSTDNGFHMYVITRKGKIAWRMEKGQYPEAKARELIEPVVKRALAAK